MDRLVEAKWDCYQCKHYNKPLSLSMVQPELEKFLSFVFLKEYPMPHKYYLVGPCGVGPSLKDMILQSKPNIKDELLKSFKNKPQPFLEFVRSFDYSCIGFVQPHEMFTTLMNSRWGAAIFAMPLKPWSAPNSDNPPLAEEQSAQYVKMLQAAYCDYKKTTDLLLENLYQTEPLLWDHFEKSRKAFHSTEAMFRFYRESVPPNSDRQLLEEVENGIDDVVYDPDIPDGFRRVIKAVSIAKQMSLTKSIYKDQIGAREREGACHHLANRSEKPIKWVT